MSVEKDYEHPAQGVLVVTKSSGNRALFGSDVKHRYFITLQVCTARHRRSLGQDWISPNNTLVEVQMSEAQWGAFVSSFGNGSGTPCTLSFTTKDGSLPPYPDPEHTVRKFEEDIDANSRETLVLVDKLEAELERKDAKRATLKSLVTQIKNNCGSYYRFMRKQFTEAMEDMVTEAKVEVEAYMQRRINEAGLAALGAEKPIELPEGE